MSIVILEKYIERSFDQSSSHQSTFPMIIANKRCPSIFSCFLLGQRSVRSSSFLLTYFMSRMSLGFGDFVPMQKDDYGNISWLYILFCIMFILTGLTIVASSGNLLILRFVETNTKRSQHERHEIEERRRQQVRIVGDVISSNGRLITLEDDEDTPSLLPPVGAQRVTMGNSTSDLSLCSCRAQPSLSICLPHSCRRKFKRKHMNIMQNSKRNCSQPQMIVIRTLREQILDSLQSKTELDEHVALQRSYPQLESIQKRSSI
jgi:hypothetical protein